MPGADRRGGGSLPPAGTLFAGRYRLERKLAEGGMGAIYAATERPTGRQVALKVLHPELVADDELRRRFRRESSILAALDHPGVVRTYDFGTDEQGRCWTSMELLEGETLRSRIEREGRLEPASLVPIVQGVCDALGAVHAHGVVHGDLKPDNVFLTGGEPAAKLVDFGLSKVQGLERLTRTGEVTGTPAYMAPELLTGEGAPDGRVDTYALGVILYEALSGKQPFQERNPGKLMFDVVMGKSRPLEEARPDLSPGLVEVVSHAMAAKRDQRFDGPEALARAFRTAAGAA